MLGNIFLTHVWSIPLKCLFANSRNSYSPIAMSFFVMNVFKLLFQFQYKWGTLFSQLQLVSNLKLTRAVACRAVSGWAPRVPDVLTPMSACSCRLYATLGSHLSTLRAQFRRDAIYLQLLGVTQTTPCRATEVCRFVVDLRGGLCVYGPGKAPRGLGTSVWPTAQ